VQNGDGIPLRDLQAIKTWADANKAMNLKWDANAPPFDP